MATTAEVSVETVVVMAVEMTVVIRTATEEAVAADTTVSAKSAEPPRLSGRQKRLPETPERLSGTREKLSEMQERHVVTPPAA